mmetsp:Transcript_5477/g.9283  ORF Transcript_5477/g.9283 Transcript_5477/m.9283 type:complete len:363 (+) Transcript_5477:1018-2106(+)
MEGPPEAVEERGPPDQQVLEPDQPQELQEEKGDPSHGVQQRLLPVPEQQAPDQGLRRQAPRSGLLGHLRLRREAEGPGGGREARAQPAPAAGRAGDRVPAEGGPPPQSTDLLSPGERRGLHLPGGGEVRGRLGAPGQPHAAPLRGQAGAARGAELDPLPQEQQPDWGVQRADPAAAVAPIHPFADEADAGGDKVPPREQHRAPRHQAQQHPAQPPPPRQDLRPRPLQAAHEGDGVLPHRGHQGGHRLAAQRGHPQREGLRVQEHAQDAEGGHLQPRLRLLLPHLRRQPPLRQALRARAEDPQGRVRPGAHSARARAGAELRVREHDPDDDQAGPPPAVQGQQDHQPRLLLEQRQEAQAHPGD